jgi:hypothetical protein
VYCYVKKRLRDTFPDEYEAWAEDNITPDMSENEIIKLTGDWYFSFSNDETVEAFYKIKAHYQSDSEGVNLTSNMLADFQIKDWHLTEIGENWTGPKAHRDTYRFVIEQSPTTQQIYFKVYSVSIDHINPEVTQNGLAGVIEIRNGKPALSMGIHEGELPIHVESDINKGLFLHTDNHRNPVRSTYASYDHGLSFEALYFQCDDGSWLLEARSEMANAVFESYVFRELIVCETDGWEIAGSFWQRHVYFEKPTGGDSIKGRFEVTFEDESIVVRVVVAGLLD